MKNILYLFLLFTLNSQAQLNYIGEPISSVKKNYDSIVYESKDTLVVNDVNYINFIAINDTITHLVKILPTSYRQVIYESFETMIESKGKYFFEYEEGLYCMYIVELEDINYFGLYLGRIE